MAGTSLEDLFLDELKDVLSAEKQLLKALPKLAKAAESPKLEKAFQTHKEQTQEQITRLEKVFDLLGRSATAKKCEAMEGLVKEAQEVIESHDESAVRDAALIGAAQKAEHYEIASYGTLRTLAQMLGMDKAVGLLDRTLTEEKETDQLLTEIAESEINLAAASEKK